MGAAYDSLFSYYYASLVTGTTLQRVRHLHSGFALRGVHAPLPVRAVALCPCLGDAGRFDGGRAKSKLLGGSSFACIELSHKHVVTRHLLSLRDSLCVPGISWICVDVDKGN